MRDDMSNLSDRRHFLMQAAFTCGIIITSKLYAQRRLSLSVLEDADNTQRNAQTIDPVKH
jgi:hypothetical protein